MLLLLFLLCAFQVPSSAQQTSNWCMGNNPINAGKCTTCTANDVSISDLKLLSGPPSCTIGQQITISIRVKWLSTANGRYDVAAYLANDGGNAIVGSCNEFILSPIGTPPQYGTPTSPTLGPFQELNNDKCGDLDSTNVVYQRIDQITITCRDQDKNGIADVSGCTSWNQNQNDNNCLGVSTAQCGSPSKCRCEPVLNIAGLGTCLQSQAGCTAAVDSASSCNGAVFAALVSVSTTSAPTSTIFTPNAVFTGNLYYSLSSKTASMAFQYFAPGTTIASASNSTPIVRTDLLNPCQVQRQVTCGTGTTCVSIAETQLIPRLFHELGDVACAGNVCVGATRTPPSTCPVGYSRTGVSGSHIRFIYTLSDKVTSCAAEAADGTFYQLFSPTIGATSFNFAPSTSCVYPVCAIDVELVFVIDEQLALSPAGYSNVLNYVAGIINRFTTSSKLTRFGIHFAQTSTTASPPLILTQLTAAPNLITNVLMPHVQYQGQKTDFATAVTSAIDKFWPSATSATNVAREVLTIVGGPDGGTLGYTTVQTLLAAKGVTAWAVGVETGAGQQTLLKGISTTGSYLHYESVFDTNQLAVAIGYQAQILCPQSNLCGTACKGFCTCSSPGVNTCACPTCAPTNCVVNQCDNAAIGCVSSPKVCNDNNACTDDSCDAATGNCLFTPFPASKCGGGTSVCVPSVGCVTPPSCPSGTCANMPCYTQTCVNGACVPNSPGTVCDDGNACTTDTCDAVKGCVYTPYSCPQTSACFATTCVPGSGTQPNCRVGSASASCSDNNACTDDSCVDPTGCVFTNYTCSASTVPCSFQSGCDGLGLAQPNCLIANYSCGLSAAAVAGISVGAAVGAALAAVAAVLIALFLSKKGYDYYQAQNSLSNRALQNNAAYQENPMQGEMK